MQQCLCDPWWWDAKTGPPALKMKMFWQSKLPSIQVADDLTSLIDTANAPIFVIDMQGRANVSDAFRRRCQTWKTMKLISRLLQALQATVQSFWLGVRVESEGGDSHWLWQARGASPCSAIWRWALASAAIVRTECCSRILTEPVMTDEGLHQSTQFFL